MQTPPFITKRIVNSQDEHVYEGFLIDLFEEIKARVGADFPEYVFEETSESSIGIMELNVDEEDEIELEFNGIMNEMFEDVSIKEIRHL